MMFWNVANQRRNDEITGKIAPMLKSALPAFAAPLLVMLAVPAAAQTCEDPAVAGLRICSDQAAAALTNGTAWISCSGTCLVVPDADGVSVVDGDRQILARFDGARFLAGTGATRDLSLLPFLTTDGHLLLADPRSPQSVRRLSLSSAVAGNPASSPRFSEEARLSADGRRFFVPSLDGPGFALWQISGDGLMPYQPTHPILLISQSGRYAATVDPDGDGMFRVEDYGARRFFLTSARFELDTPLFDIHEQYFVRRYKRNAQLFAVIYRLGDRKQLGDIPWPTGMSTTFRVEVRDDGMELIDASPE